MRRELWALRFRRRRQNQPAQRHRRTWRRWGWGVSTLMALLVALGIPPLGVFYARLTASLPPPEALETWVAFPQGRLYRPTVITDRHGQPLGTLQATGGLFVALDDLPAPVPPIFQAVLARADGQSDPGQAVAERLVRLWLLPKAGKSGVDALQVALLTRQIRQRYGDHRLLTWYLNTVPLGNETYGLDAAARFYFGHGAQNLTLAETVTLAAVALAPDLNPFASPDLIRDQRNRWAIRLTEDGILTPEQAQDVAAQPLPTPPATPPPPLPWPAHLALDEAVAALHWPAPSRGLTLHTTVEADLQQQAACLTQAVIQAQASADCPAAQRLPATALEEPLPKGSTAEALVLATASGQILAYAGYPENQDPGTYPPGTALAPWVYLTALSRGLSPGSLIWDIPSRLPPGVEATNPDGRFHGPITLRAALANGYTVPTVTLLYQLGPETVWQTARRVGLETLPPSAGDQAYPWLLGQKGDLTLLDLAYALTPLATLGVLPGQAPSDQGALRPAALMSAQTIHGTPLLQWETPRQQVVLSQGLAYLITHILSDAPARWPAYGHPNPLEIGRPVAAYVGLAREGQVAWVLGYTPSRIVAVVVQTPHGHARPTALALWHALAQYALQDLPPENWLMPPEVTTVPVCSPSGLLPTADCPNVVNEVFLMGNEPTTPDNLYRRLAVNRETGRLATIFTPPELVEERVYLQFPPDARAWAETAGLDLPPQEYDLIVPPAPAPEAQLVAPVAFGYVGPRVTLKGTAAGNRFAAYRVQVGPGINPQTWVTVAQGDQPITHGTLGVWETTDLAEGLYTVQLQVTTTDRRILTHTIQVTVDHTPPRLMVTYPPNGESLSYHS